MMPIPRCSVILLALAPLFPGAFAPSLAARESTVVFEKPGKKWEAEALPIGNGRIGAMIFGGTSVDRIQFNDITLWTGDQKPADSGYKYGKDEKGVFGSYQNFGDLFVSFGEANAADLATGSSDDRGAGAFGDAMKKANAEAAAPLPGYRRELNMSTARVTTAFRKDGVAFSR